MIGASPGEIGGRVVLLELVRSSGGDRKQVLQAGATGRPLSSPEKKGDGGDDPAEEGGKLYSKMQISMLE